LFKFKSLVDASIKYGELRTFADTEEGKAEFKRVVKLQTDIDFEKAYPGLNDWASDYPNNK
jgi:hypothetical protein